MFCLKWLVLFKGISQPKLSNQNVKYLLVGTYSPKKLKVCHRHEGLKKLTKNTILLVLVTHKNSELSRKVQQLFVGKLTPKWMFILSQPSEFRQVFGVLKIVLQFTHVSRHPGDLSKKNNHESLEPIVWLMRSQIYQKVAYFIEKNILKKKILEIWSSL